MAGRLLVIPNNARQRLLLQRLEAAQHRPAAIPSGAKIILIKRATLIEKFVIIGLPAKSNLWRTVITRGKGYIGHEKEHSK